MNISQFLDKSWNTIYNYFVDTQIIINDNDNYKTKITKYLLKYKRIIGLVLLIILLVIGYYECYENNEYYEYKNITQIGGEYDTYEKALASERAREQSNTHLATAKATLAKEKADAATAKAAADTKAKTDAATAEKARKAGLSSADRKKEKAADKKNRDAAKSADKKERKDSIVADSKKAAAEKTDAKKILQKANKMKAVDSANKKFADFKAKGVSGNLKSGLKGAYNVGAAGAQSIRENADWFYGMLYSIIISLAICIITIPSIAFFICGIICYFLLKNNMKSIKSF